MSMIIQGVDRPNTTPIGQDRKYKDLQSLLTAALKFRVELAGIGSKFHHGVARHFLGGGGGPSRRIWPMSAGIGLQGHARCKTICDTTRTSVFCRCYLPYLILESPINVSLLSLCMKTSPKWQVWSDFKKTLCPEPQPANQNVGTSATGSIEATNQRAALVRDYCILLTATPQKPSVAIDRSKMTPASQLRLNQNC